MVTRLWSITAGTVTAAGAAEKARFACARMREKKENETHEEIRDFISLNCNSWRALPCIPSCRT